MVVMSFECEKSGKVVAEPKKLVEFWKKHQLMKLYLIRMVRKKEGVKKFILQ